MVENRGRTYKNGDYKRYFSTSDTEIFGFFEKYRFLSNFHRCNVMWDGVLWPSSEHAYMASKCARSTTDPEIDVHYYNGDSHHHIRDMSCAEVKKWGQQVQLRPFWEDLKFAFMLQINLDKYLRNKDLRDKLLATGCRELVEANSWGDTCWGVDVDKMEGRNALGITLMNIRERLQTKCIRQRTFRVIP